MEGELTLITPKVKVDKLLKLIIVVLLTVSYLTYRVNFQSSLPHCIYDRYMELTVAVNKLLR